MRKITLINHWSDDNKGDSAITLGTITLLKDLFKDEKLEIKIISMVNEINPQKNMRFILNRYPDIKVVSNPYNLFYATE